MAQSDNYGYGGTSGSNYKSYNDDDYNYRLQEARKRAAQLAAAKAAAARITKNQSYMQYQGQGNDRRDESREKWYKSMLEQQKQAKIDYDKQQRLGNRLTNMPANQSGINIWSSLQKLGSNMNKNLELGLKGIDHAGEVYQNISRQQGSSNNPYANRYNPSAFAPTGSPYGYSNAGWGTGNYGGQFGNLNKPYTYGQAMTPDDYARMGGDYKARLLDRISRNIVNNQSDIPANNGIPVLTSEYDEYLDALRYGTRGGGMASQGYTGVDTYVPPEELPLGGGGGDNSGGGGGYYDPYGYTWGDMNLRGGGGYGGGGYGYGGYGGNNYRINYNNNYRGGTGTRSNDIASWYANMVNWNIGRPKGG